MVVQAHPTAPTPARDRSLIPCHVCSCGNFHPYIEARGYRVVRCGICGLWYVNPQPTPDELAQFYAEYDEGEQWREMQGHFNRAVQRIVCRFKSGGDALDVGSGSGNFLVCMREAGFSVFGLEPSRTGSQFARSVHGVETFNGMVEDYVATSDPRSFDVVTLLNVLEHLRDPGRTLTQLRQLLKPGAIVAVVVPDARFHAVIGTVRKWMGASDPYWLQRPHAVLAGFKLPDHMCCFQPRTLAALFRRCGYRVEYLQNAPIVSNPQWRRNLAKCMMRSLSQLLYYLSLRQLVFGYSTMLIASRQPE